MISVTNHFSAIALQQFLLKNIEQGLHTCQNCLMPEGVLLDETELSLLAQCVYRTCTPVYRSLAPTAAHCNNT